MPKSIVLGNGNILVGLDTRGQVRDFTFPYVGLENHIAGLRHRIGVFFGGAMHWFDDPGWRIEVDCAKGTFASEIHAINESIGISCILNDIVYNESNIFVRSMSVTNTSGVKSDIKIFFCHEFELHQTFRGDTAFFDPERNVIVHYEGRRVFLAYAAYNSIPFDDYTVGLFGMEGREGSHKDAEDGVLSRNPIEHGRVDSVLSLPLSLAPGEEQTLFYWLIVAQTFLEASQIHDDLVKRTPAHIMKTTKDFWHAWVNRQNFSFYGLMPPVVDLFKKSLFYLRAHADNRGAIIASGDSDMLQYGRDTYSYMWPRDGAISALALARAGDFNVARRFFEFCNEVVTDNGYFLHKYRPDKSWGSSWHPWIRADRPELPIQEDETALIIYSLWEYYELSKDLEFVELIYNSLIKRSADFMAAYIDPNSGLPNPSYDLWEEKHGVSTYTAAATSGGLAAAARFAGLLGKTDSQQAYTDASIRIKRAIMDHLYDPANNMFLKLVKREGKEFNIDPTIDMSSVYGIYEFDILDAHDQRLKDAMRVAKNRLSCNTPIGGLSRYEGDWYYRISPDAPANPWIVTTLWYAQYLIAISENEKDLDEVKKWFDWCAIHASWSGVIAEQINPYTGEQISAAPLTWSHSEFILTVILYLEKLEEFGVCKACYPLQ